MKREDVVLGNTYLLYESHYKNRSLRAIVKALKFWEEEGFRYDVSNKLDITVITVVDGSLSTGCVYGCSVASLEPLLDPNDILKEIL